MITGNMILAGLALIGLAVNVVAWGGCYAIYYGLL